MKSEGCEPDAKNGGPRANPNPWRMVRHEGPRDHADALEGPDDSGEGDEDPEDDRDHAHGTPDSTAALKPWPMPSRPGSDDGRPQPPVVTRPSCSRQLRYNSSISYGGAWHERYRRRAFPTLRMPCVEPAGKYTAVSGPRIFFSWPESTSPRPSRM